MLLPGIHLSAAALLIALVRPFSVQAQSAIAPEPPVAQVEKVITAAGINYLGLAVSQERGLTDRITVLYGLGVHYSFYDTDAPPPVGARFIEVLDKSFGRSYQTNGITPYALAEARLYTTLEKRKLHGRDVRANCARYFALLAEIPFATGNLVEVPELRVAYPVGLKYGMRLPLGSRLYVEGSIGAVAKITRVQQSLQPRLDFALAWHK
ncbi:hypothetical protein GCM10022408_00500 [Hymenobacter fastidiosus]|uniref:DUF3575 domain-containing protein n=1 Tax=Hymenobacter fastidiosus TaxID=486264 RepID=A0ABP7RAW0_9BACT